MRDTNIAEGNSWFLTQGVSSPISTSGCHNVWEHPCCMSEGTGELVLFEVFLSLKTHGDLQFWSDFQHFGVIQSQDICVKCPAGNQINS